MKPFTFGRMSLGGKARGSVPEVLMCRIDDGKQRKCLDVVIFGTVLDSVNYKPQLIYCIIYKIY